MAKTIAERADVVPVLAEVFRKHGYEGASLALLGEATELGKGSLYHFFPGGKEAMAAAVLADVDAWFEANVFTPLKRGADPALAVEAMFDATVKYFNSGRRVCLVGVLALGDARDHFATAIRSYFAQWIAALASALRRLGHDRGQAASLAEDTVAGIQGAIVLSRALEDAGAFGRAMTRLRRRLS